MTDYLRRRSVLPAAADSGDLGRNLEAAIAAFKLIESAQARWRAVNAPHLVALDRNGAKLEKGKLVQRPDEPGGETQAA